MNEEGRRVIVVPAREHRDERPGSVTNAPATSFASARLSSRVAAETGARGCSVHRRLLSTLPKAGCFLLMPLLMLGLSSFGCSEMEQSTTIYRTAIGVSDPSARIRTALNCTNCEILNLSERMLPRMRKQVTAAKVFRPDTREYLMIALDENGTAVDAADLERQE